MPVQKGKRRKRPRKRSSGYDTNGQQVEVAEPVAPQKPERKGWLRRPPLWLNLTFGIAMLILAVLFFLQPQKGIGGTQRLLLLLAYVAVASFYLFNALQQYRGRQKSR